MNRREFLAGLGFATQGRKSFDGIFGLDDPAQRPVVAVRQPYLQNVRRDRASVMWATDLPGSGWVRYSADGANFQSASALPRTFGPGETFMTGPFTQYIARLPRLSSDCTYVYRVYVDGEPISPFSTFRTPGSGGPFRFLVLGDSGMGTSLQGRVASQMGTEDASLVLHVGDIAYGHGNFQQFQRNYFDYYSGLMARMPFFTAPGNHEYENPDAAAYLSLHSLPVETVPAPERGRYYSFDWCNVHFVSLDTTMALRNAVEGRGEMLRWLERDLRATRQFWRVVYFHHPPYAGGRNFADPHEWLVRSHVRPILEANGVQIALSGHEHNYQRTHDVRADRVVPRGTGTVYVTSGGGGAMLYPEVFHLPQTAVQHVTGHYVRIEVEGTRMTLRAIDDGGDEFDKLSLVPQPGLDHSRGGITFDPGTAAGALVRIRGWNLADREAFSSTPASSLSGTSLSIEGRQIPLIYVSPTQIVGQLPESLSAPPTTMITTSNGSLVVEP